jgi:hypothetical protein
MSDIFNGTWGFNLGDINAAGVTAVMVAAPADSSAYLLGIPRDAKISIAAQTKPDTLLRPYAYGWLVKNTVQCIQASSAVIKMLDKLISAGSIGSLLQLTDGNCLNSAGLIALSPPAPTPGIKWKLMCGGDFNDFRVVEYTFQIALQKDEIGHYIVKQALPTVIPNSSDLFYPLSQITLSADAVPSGISKIEFKASTDADWADFGDFHNGKYTFECIGEEGGGGRKLPRTSAIKFSIEASGLQTSQTEFGLLNQILDNPIDVRITHMDGKTCTLTNQYGQMAPELSSDGNVDKTRELKVKVEGAITNFSSIPDPVHNPTVSLWSSLWS